MLQLVAVPLPIYQCVVPRCSAVINCALPLQSHVDTNYGRVVGGPLLCTSELNPDAVEVVFVCMQCMTVLERSGSVLKQTPERTSTFSRCNSVAFD